jgi:hypothetical protein
LFSQDDEALMGFNARDDGLEFIGRDALAVVSAGFPALEQVVRALGNGLPTALELVGLLVEVAANHSVDLGDSFADGSPFFLLEPPRDFPRRPVIP